MNKNLMHEVETRLLLVLSELEKQRSMASNYRSDVLPFEDDMKQLHEYVESAGEYEIAYESMVATIQAVPFSLSGKAAIALLELGLLFGYKTDLKGDVLFDRRKA